MQAAFRAGAQDHSPFVLHITKPHYSLSYLPLHTTPLRSTSCGATGSSYKEKVLPQA
jgi:hypothetical protein